MEAVGDEGERTHGVTWAVSSVLWSPYEREADAPTMSSTKKKMTSMIKRRVILVERDKAMAGGGRKREGDETCDGDS